MSEFREAFAILYTPDVERSFAFYRDLLGFEELYRNHAPDGAVDFVSATLDDFKLGLTRDERSGDAFALWLYTDDVDAQVERLRTNGVPVQLEPADMPWGERMAFVADPAGNRIVIGARLDATG